MNKNISLLVLIFVSCASFAQVILPDFEKASLVKKFKSDAEESSIFTYNKGENIFFYRVFIKGEGDKATILRQNIWYSKRVGDNWEQADRLFTEDDYPGEVINIGSSRDGKRVYVFQTQFIGEDSLSRRIGYVEQIGDIDDDWSEIKEITIPNLELGENYYHFHLNHDENILMISMSPSDAKLDEDLYVSIKKDGNWSAPKSLGSTINTSRVELSPFIANDGKTLYFSSEGHGGFGAADVFVSYRLDDSWTKWTKPKNLGENINTKDYEENFIPVETKEYFFTSNYNSNTADIYYSRTNRAVTMNSGKAVLLASASPLGRTTVEVYNENNELLDSKVTDTKGEMSFIKLNDEPKLIFKIKDASKHKGAKFYLLDKDGEKVKRYTINKNGELVDYKALNKDQKLSGKLLLNGQAVSDEEIMVYDENDFLIKKVNTSQDGSFSINKSMFDQTLRFDASVEDGWSIENMNYEKDGMLFSDNIQLKNNSIDFNSIKPSKKAIAGEGETLNNGTADLTINFEFLSKNIRNSDIKKADDLIKKLKGNDNKITLIGHTDYIGSEDANYRMGLKRAETVKSYLIERGINANRIKVESMGETQPLDKNQSERARATNRRVEVRIG